MLLYSQRQLSVCCQKNRRVTAFHTAAYAAGKTEGRFTMKDPKIPVDEGTEYIATVTI